MYQAIATPTVKGYGPRATWSQYQDERIAQAATLRELKQKLAEHYGKSWRHKRPMYQDRKDGPPVRIGWVIGMRMSDGGACWIQQDWVHIIEVKGVILKD